MGLSRFDFLVGNVSDRCFLVEITTRKGERKGYRKGVDTQQRTNAVQEFGQEDVTVTVTVTVTVSVIAQESRKSDMFQHASRVTSLTISRH